MAVGGLAGIYIARGGKMVDAHKVGGVGFLTLVFLMFFGLFSIGHHPIEYDIVTGGVIAANAFIPQLWLLLLVVGLSLLFVVSDNTNNSIVKVLVNFKPLCMFGMMSYSIFIWHQPLLAFYRYFVAREITLVFGISFAIVVVLLSVVTYYTMEKKIKSGLMTSISLVVSFIIVNVAALSVYLHAGVVRDVPELNIVKSEAYRDMFSGYNDRIYKFDKEFSVANGKKNVLLVGNSFIRDWGNILLESKYADKINLSYSPKFQEELISRIAESDYVFVFDWKKNIPEYVWQNLKTTATVYGLGTKSYGSGNGIIYKNRNKPDERLRAEWGGGYLLIS